MPVNRVTPALWTMILDAQGAALLTPAGGRNFLVGSGDDHAIDVFTGRERETRVRVPRLAFEQTLAFLATGGHVGDENALAVQSSSDPRSAGPLCRAARLRANGTLGARVITYVLPLLEYCDVVGIDRMRMPSATWLET